MNSSDSERWLEAMKSEMESIYGLRQASRRWNIVLTELDLNTALHLPTEDFADYPSDEDLLGFFAWIQCSLDENNMIPRVIYQNHLPKE